MKLVLLDAILILGLACVLWGEYQVYPPAMWITLGSSLMIGAMLVGRAMSPAPQKSDDDD